MASLHRTIEVPRTAHLHQLGTLSPETNHLWIVLHGYGQLARYFIRHFEPLVDDQTAVIAPEGLSRFYLEGFSGRVGATWMTKEERLHEIADYVSYLNLVREMALREAPNADLHLLGFSQGAATVCRWLGQAQWPVRQLVLWAGVFPEDMELTSASHPLKETNLTYVYGLHDHFVAKDKVQAQLNRVQEAGLHPEVISFEGKHELNQEVLLALKNRKKG
ncbi:alpha/beta hydrolase [Rufibacter hautae]|uniref:Phospholipase n=1 Tax=Rufibacter hautae TaxID=2595005 RepID=A0A5B6TIP4_9BACT|nr:phospholipase [Rufibacter hautae]KAA3439360.1 phospholipase [Rufibacter hautae]